MQPPTAPQLVCPYILLAYVPLTCPADVVANGSETASLTKRVDEHQNTVNSILEKFKEYLMAEVSNRDKLEKQVNQFQYTLKEVKGRVGVLEPKFKAMLGDMDKLETDVDEIRNDNSFMSATTKSDSGPTSFFQDQIERLGSSVQVLTKKLKELEADVDMHRMVINELNEKTNKSDGLKSEHGWPVVQPVQGDGWATSNGDSDGWVASSSNGHGKAVDKSEALDVVRLDIKVVSHTFYSQRWRGGITDRFPRLTERVGERDPALAANTGQWDRREARHRQLPNARSAVREISQLLEGHRGIGAWQRLRRSRMGNARSSCVPSRVLR